MLKQVQHDMPVKYLSPWAGFLACIVHADEIRFEKEGVSGIRR